MKQTILVHAWELEIPRSHSQKPAILPPLGLTWGCLLLTRASGQYRTIAPWVMAASSILSIVFTVFMSSGFGEAACFLQIHGVSDNGEGSWTTAHTGRLYSPLQAGSHKEGCTDRSSQRTLNSSRYRILEGGMSVVLTAKSPEKHGSRMVWLHGPKDSCSAQSDTLLTSVSARPLHLPQVFGPSPSQLVLIWFLWNSFLFCFVFNNSQIFMYSFIKSLWWQICLWRPGEAVGNPRVSTQTCLQWRSFTMGTHKLIRAPSSVFLESSASPSPLVCPGMVPCTDFSLWSNRSRSALALSPEWGEERQKLQAQSHSLLSLETGACLLKSSLAASHWELAV